MSADSGETLPRAVAETEIEVPQPAEHNEPRYINREISWLEFNARVLEEALQRSTPLLERLKFLSIFTSNLDEFFMVRVAGLQKMLEEGILSTESPEGSAVAQVCRKLRKRTIDLTNKQYECLLNDIVPALKQQNVHILKPSELSPYQKAEIDQYYREEIYPVLTPLAFDPAHPFPFLANQSMYLVVIPKDTENFSKNMPPLGFVEVPSVLPRLIQVRSKNKQHLYITLEDLIAEHFDSIFVGYEIDGWHPIRVIRNLDYTLLENKVVDLLTSIQKEMISREHNEVVRLEVDPRLPKDILEVIKAEAKISSDQVYEINGPLYLPGLMQLYKLPLPDLKDPPFNPRLPIAMADNVDIFTLISRGDILVHHPYESFYAVTEFVNSAAHDPNVLAIKQTLYRTAGDSPIIDALINAAENGKHVTAVVELKARFDEKNNISWARRLERAGVHVVFGFVGLKTHCKCTLVVRREDNKLSRYTHLATGNYNSTTAKLYTDLGYFTRDEQIANDVSQVFNLITGFNILTGENKQRSETKMPPMKKLALAPIGLRQKLMEMIDNEMACVRKHGSGHIMAKMNALADKQIIDKLYEASAAGVKIQLIIRGICCLRPQVPGLSDNIEVISIIDRFLEHTRIFYFQAAGQRNIYLGSADWLPRNMDRRIEVIFPVENERQKKRIIDGILKVCWADNTKAREIQSDGSFILRTPVGNEPVIRSQQRFIEMVRDEGLKSIPYEAAIRHNPVRQKGERPVAKKNKK